jgi:O-antigen/teichoic acid export membrane protein
MGIIIKQSIKGNIWSYLGVIVGFVTTAYLFPNYLSTDTIGLFGLLLSWSIIFTQISSLGFPGVTSRLFPYFRDPAKNHNGYFFITLLVTIAGFLAFYIFFLFFSPFLVESNLEKSKMFSDYVYLLLPLTFFTLFFVQLDTINKLLYDAVFGTFLQEFLQRILIFTVTMLFVAGIFNLHQLIIAYSAAVCAKGLVLFVYLLFKGEVSFKRQPGFISPHLRKEMISVATFSILTGLGGSIVFNIDKILINQILGLSDTGVYTIAFFFSTLIIIPSRPLLRIAGTLIADAFKRDDIAYIDDIYRRSCINQFIIGTFLFGGIWINIDNILIILGPDYTGAKWVIFFIAVGYLIDMATGANAQIIAFSKHYRVALFFLIILIALVVVSILLLVPVWGITGAAVAVALSFAVNNFMRFNFLKRKYNMQPFTLKIVIAAGVFILSAAVVALMPTLSLIPDLIIRSAVFTLIFGALTIGLKISEDLNGLFREFMKILRKR